MELFCFTLNMSSGINLNDLGTKPLFTLVCLSIHKPHQFCLFETLALVVSDGIGGGFFHSVIYHVLQAERYKSATLQVEFCLDSQPRSRLYMN